MTRKQRSLQLFVGIGVGIYATFQGVGDSRLCNFSGGWPNDNCNFLWGAPEAWGKRQATWRAFRRRLWGATLMGRPTARGDARPPAHRGMATNSRSVMARTEPRPPSWRRVGAQRGAQKQRPRKALPGTLGNLVKTMSERVAAPINPSLTAPPPRRRCRSWNRRSGRLPAPPASR